MNSTPARATAHSATFTATSAMHSSSQAIFMTAATRRRFLHHRLVQGQDFQALLFNPHVPVVDLVVAVDNLLRDGNVRTVQLIDGAMHNIFCRRAHRHDVLVSDSQISSQVD